LVTRLCAPPDLEEYRDPAIARLQAADVSSWRDAASAWNG
jgi:hypothetical protein